MRGSAENGLDLRLEPLARPGTTGGATEESSHGFSSFGRIHEDGNMCEVGMPRGEHALASEMFDQRIETRVARQDVEIAEWIAF